MTCKRGYLQSPSVTYRISGLFSFSYELPNSYSDSDVRIFSDDALVRKIKTFPPYEFHHTNKKCSTANTHVQQRTRMFNSEDACSTGGCSSWRLLKCLSHVLNRSELIVVEEVCYEIKLMWFDALINSVTEEELNGTLWSSRIEACIDLVFAFPVNNK